jgi:putative nucleotidyltransferase with HDIG domain
MAMPGVDATSILLLDRSLHTLAYSVGGGFRTTHFSGTRFRIDEGLAGLAAMKRRPIIAPPESFGFDTPTRGKMMAAEGFVAYAGFPLIAKGEVVGVLEVFARTPFDGRSDTLEFLELLAGQTAIAIDNAALFENLQRSNTSLVLAYDATIEGWSRALELRDSATEGHSQRVTQMTMSLACALRVPGEQLEHIRRGALLHDIGKMAVPDSILQKPGILTDAEQAIMRQHTQHALEMLSLIEFLHPAIDIPYCHHERWDGSGYPRGLAGRSIPLSARIFAVADVWDALCSDRPYRPAWPAEKALEYIRQQAGIQFDPAVVDAFLKTVAADAPPENSP